MISEKKALYIIIDVINNHTNVPAHKVQEEAEKYLDQFIESMYTIFDTDIENLVNNLNKKYT